MASSGTFTGKRYGGSYGPWLTLAWTQVSQSVANNTTTLDLTLRFHWSANIQLTFNNKGGSLQGHSYTASGSASGTSGSRVLKTQRVTIKHNSNGTRSVTLSGNITGLGLNWSGTRVNTMSVSGTANLNTIPRRTTMSAFSFASPLKVSTGATINYTIDRKSSGFRHYIELKDGSHLIKSWNNVNANGASTLTLTGTEVNSIIKRMSNTTTKSLNLAMRTRSGVNGGWVDTSVNRNATVSLDSGIKPTVSAVTLSQTGNPVSTHTLQGFSKIKARFTRSAGYGATITSSSIQVRRRSGGADSQTINSNDGTTANPVSLHGVYEARGTARDSRGRTTHTAWATITVTRYNAPSITNFSAVRNGSTPTTVNISRATTHTVLGTSNHLTYTIQRRQGTGAWTNVNSGATGTVTTSGATGSATSTGNSVTQSYEFRLVVTDKLGRRAESVQSVSTQRVVLDIHKNEGVGIGKIHERGVLDVDGAIYTSGVRLDQTETDLPSGDGTKNYWYSLTPGVYRLNPNAFPNQPRPYGFIQVQRSANSVTATVTPMGLGGTLSHEIYILVFNSNTPEKDLIWLTQTGYQTGSSSNGEWVKFSDGTLICWGYDLHVFKISITSDMASGWRRIPSQTQELPATYKASGNSNVGEFAVLMSTSWEGASNSVNIFASSWSRRADHFTWFAQAPALLENQSFRVHWMTIGRWK